MEFRQVVNKRYSVRQFKPNAVDDKTIKEIIELAKFAPSAGNLQAYKVFVTHEKIAYEAPASLVVCADLKKSASRYGGWGRNLYAIQDATIFGAYLQLAAVELGLATCWAGAFRESKVRERLKIPDNLKPIAIIPLGYSSQEKTGRRRRTYEDIRIHSKEI